MKNYRLDLEEWFDDDSGYWYYQYSLEEYHKHWLTRRYKWRPVVTYDDPEYGKFYAMGNKEWAERVAKRYNIPLPALKHRKARY